MGGPPDSGRPVTSRKASDSNGTVFCGFPTGLPRSVIPRSIGKELPWESQTLGLMLTIWLNFPRKKPSNCDLAREWITNGPTKLAMFNVQLLNHPFFWDMIIAMDTATPQLRAVPRRNGRGRRWDPRKLWPGGGGSGFPQLPGENVGVQKSGPGNDCYSLLLKIVMYTLW